MQMSEKRMKVEVLVEIARVSKLDLLPISYRHRQQKESRRHESLS